MPIKKRDPAAPGFPHGTPHGYCAGCTAAFPCPASPTCHEAYNAHRAQRAKERGSAPSHYDARPVRQYLRRFTERGWAIRNIAAAAGVDRKAVAEVMRCSRRVSRGVAAKLMAVTIDDLLAASKGYIPVHYAQWKIGSLWALGYPSTEIADRLGYHRIALNRIMSGRSANVTRSFYDDLTYLHEMIGNNPAPESRAAARARANARRRGYRTPDAYTPDGLLWEDVTKYERRDEELERRLDVREARAERYLVVLEKTLVYRLPPTEIAQELGVSSDLIFKILGEVKVRMRREDTFEPGCRFRYTIRPDNRERAAEVLAVLEEWRAALPPVDPYPYVARLGLMTGREYAGLERRYGRPRLRKAAA